VVISLIVWIAGCWRRSVWLIDIVYPVCFYWSNMTVLKGKGLQLLAALCWALSILQVRIHQWKGSALELAPWQICEGLLIVTPIAYFSGTRDTVWNRELLCFLPFGWVKS